MAPRPLKQAVPHIHPGPLLVLTAIIALGVLAATGRIPGLASLVASTTSSLYTAPATLYVIPQGETTLTVGDTSVVDINLNTKSPANVIGTTLTFPAEFIDIITVSKEKSLIDLWTEDTTIREEAGELRFSGGTTRPGGHIATGTLLTITFKARKSGEATISFKDTQVFSHDGKGEVLEHDTRALTYSIVERAAPATTSAVTSGTSGAALIPKTDLNGDERVTLVDLSIFTIKMLGAYSPRYDFNTDGALGLSDLSILFTQMR